MKHLIHRVSPFWAGVAILSGASIGAGMFALPLAVHVSGLLPSLLLGVTAYIAVLAKHLAYGEIIASTPGKHRFPGYVRKYLGPKWGWFSLINSLLAVHATMIGYIILAGTFLAALFPGIAIVWSYIFLAVSAFVLHLNSARQLGTVNLLLVIPMVLAIIGLSGIAASHGTVANLNLTGEQPFLIFGVMLFAMGALTSVAEAYEVYRHHGKTANNNYHHSITLGMTIPAIIYLVFSVAILMVVGDNVTKDAISGLAGPLGQLAPKIGAFIGMLAVITSYFVGGFDTKEVYEDDLKLSPFTSWVLVATIPILLFAFGVTDLITLFSFIGGFFIALNGILVVLMLRQLQQAKKIKVHFLSFGSVTQITLGVIFIFSAAYQVLSKLHIL